MATREALRDWLSIAANSVGIVAVIGGGVWALISFPSLEDALRGWPAHPTVEGCVAVRGAPPRELLPASHYVEFGVSISNPTDRSVVLDSVRLRFWEGSLTDRAEHARFFDPEDPGYVEYRTTVAADETFSRESNHRAMAGFAVRPNETKHVFRGLIVKRNQVRGPYVFEGHVFSREDTTPFAYARPVWLTDVTGRCPWNAR